MVKTNTPELKRYLDKRLSLQLNGGRKVIGVLRGFDPFMNIVLEDSVEVLDKENRQLGSIV
jgi:small nuclear ribonucleoprotein G